MNFEQRQKGHAMALMFLAFAIPLGEGIALLAMVLLGLFCLLRRHELQWPRLSEGLAGVWFGGWLAWLVIGLAMVVYSELGVLKSSEVFRHAPILLGPAVFLSVRSLPQRTLDNALRLLVVMLCGSALLGLYQWATSTHSMAFLVRAESSIASQSRIPGAYEAMAAVGFYFHRLKMAHVQVLALGLLVPLLVLKPHRKLWQLFACVLFAACLGGTFAKASWGACLVGMTVVVYCLIPRLRIPFLLTGLAGALVLFHYESQGQIPLPSSVGQSLEIRAMIWGQAINIIQDYPGGVGLGNYSKVVARYYDQVLPAFHIRTYPHNLLLSWWTECGAAGMLAIVSAWFFVLLKALQGASNLRISLLNRTRYASLVFYLATFWIIGLTHDVFYHQSVALMFFGGMGWLLGQLADDEVSNKL